MRAHFFALALTLSYCHFTTSMLSVKRISGSERWGFRCGFSIFPQEYLTEETSNAIYHLKESDFFSPSDSSNLNSAASSQSDNSLHSYPAAYKGSLEFGEDEPGEDEPEEKSSKYLLWPLVDPRRNAQDNGSPQSFYLLVLKRKTRRLVGVIERYSEKKEVKCVLEDDLKRISSYLITGFQCPHDFFSAESIKEAIWSVTNARQNTERRPATMFPMSFNGYPLFGISDSLLLWPFNVKGKFSHRGIE